MAYFESSMRGAGWPGRVAGSLGKNDGMKLHITRFQDPEELFPSYTVNFSLEITPEEQKLFGGHAISSEPSLAALANGFQIRETTIGRVMERERQICEQVNDIARQLTMIKRYVASEDVVTIGTVVDGWFVVS